MLDTKTESALTKTNGTDLVVELLRRTFQLPVDVPLEDSVQLPEVPGWDSLGHVRLVREVESLLDRCLDIDEIVAIVSVGDIRTLLSQNC